jgi:O-antigen ligase
MNQPITRPLYRTAAYVGVSGCSVAAALIALTRDPDRMLSGYMLVAYAIGIGAVLSILVVNARSADLRLPMLMTWAFLFISEAVFARWGHIDDAARGNFRPEAYAEAFIWIVLLASTIFLASGRARELWTLGSTRFRWLSLYVIWAAMSIAYVPSRSLALAWIVRMVLTVSVLQVFALEAKSPSDFLHLVTVTYWGFGLLLAGAIGNAIFSSSSAFTSAGRLQSQATPVMIAMTAAITMLLAMFMFLSSRKGIHGIVVFLTMAVMLITFGKAALAASLLSGLLLFLLYRRSRLAIFFLIFFVVLCVLALEYTPAGNYISDYTRSGDAATLTGRTTMWQGALPLIAEHPLIGHGFMASKFISLRLGLPWEAGHLHNLVLDAVYNVGLIGTFLLLAFIIRTIRNTVSLLRNPRSLESRTIAMGSAAVCLFVLIIGVTEPTIGSRATGTFMVFLVVCVSTEMLASRARHRLASTDSRYRTSARNRPDYTRDAIEVPR